MQTKHTQQNLAHTAQKPNLLDHINLFPSKEEGRIPGERKALSERKTKPRRVSASVCVQGTLFVPFVWQATGKCVFF